MNLFDAYGAASKHSLITRTGIDYAIPPRDTFIDTMVAVSELLGYNDVFSDDWIVIQNKPFSPSSPPDEADRSPQPPEAGPTLDSPAAVIARSAPATSQSYPPPHFPDIIIEDGMIVLCKECESSSLGRSSDGYFCRSCGSVWRRV